MAEFRLRGVIDLDTTAFERALGLGTERSRESSAAFCSMAVQSCRGVRTLWASVDRSCSYRVWRARCIRPAKSWCRRSWRAISRRASTWTH